MSSETRARVLKAALELDYHPHAVAKNLADGRTRTIGLINPITIEHPADCFGDLGIATGSVLIGLAATQLLRQPGLATHMVYSSSDGPRRATVLVEKIHRKTTEQEENNDRNG